MLDDGCRLEIDALTVDQNRDLSPAGKRQKLRRLVHPFLKAHIAEREWLARQPQHQGHLVRRKRMRATAEREALDHCGLLSACLAIRFEFDLHNVAREEF